MMGTMKSNPRTEALTLTLTELADRGQIAQFESSNPTGNKLVWTVVLKDETADAIGDFNPMGMSTPEAEAFAAGVKLGARRKVGAGKPIKDNPYRNAIAETGVVEVDIAGKDSAEQKRMRTALFNAAYSLGLKGRFKVHTEEGKLVGTVTDKRALRKAAALVKKAVA